jgi:hypothetical protein
MLDAGYKHNVIPGRASAMVDGRFLPGFEQEWEREVDEALGPDIVAEYVHYDIALETEFEGALVDAMAGALKAEDPAPARCPTCSPAARTPRASAAWDALLRLLAAAAAGRPGLLRDVPRRRRAGAAGLPEVRRAGLDQFWTGPDPREADELGPTSAGWLRDVGSRRSRIWSGLGSVAAYQRSPSAGRG